MSTTTKTKTITHSEIVAGTAPCSARTIAEQVGRMNVLSISGGRIAVITNAEGDHVGISMPVSSGYKVIVTYQANDTYNVRRVMTRGSSIFDKGVVTDVYCEEVGEVAYQAGMYKSFEFGEQA